LVFPEQNIAKLEQILELGLIVIDPASFIRPLALKPPGIPLLDDTDLSFYPILGPFRPDVYCA